MQAQSARILTFSNAHAVLNRDISFQKPAEIGRMPARARPLVFVNHPAKVFHKRKAYGIVIIFVVVVDAIAVAMNGGA
jgi:hypothetical protein